MSEIIKGYNLRLDDLKNSEESASLPQPLPEGLALYNHPEHGLVVTSSNENTSHITSVLATTERPSPTNPNEIIDSELSITPITLVEWQDFRVHNATTVDLPPEFKLVNHPIWSLMIVRTTNQQYDKDMYPAIFVDPHDSWKIVDAHIITVHKSLLTFI